MQIEIIPVDYDRKAGILMPLSSKICSMHAQVTVFGQLSSAL